MHNALQVRVRRIPAESSANRKYWRRWAVQEISFGLHVNQGLNTSSEHCRINAKPVVAMIGIWMRYTDCLCLLFSSRMFNQMCKCV